MDTAIKEAFVHHGEFAGVPTRYYDEGSGAPVLLLHGGHFGFALPIGVECWSENVRALARTSRVLALDKLGQGLTHHPGPAHEWTFDRVLEHASAFVCDMDLRDLTVVGHSRGGLLAANLALELADRIRRVVLVSSSTVSPDHPDRPGSRFYKDLFAKAPYDDGNEAVVEHYLAAQALVPDNWRPHFVATMAERLDDERWLEGSRRYRALEVEDTYWFPTLNRFRAATLERVSQGELSVPLDIVWGADDRSAPRFIGDNLFAQFAPANPDLSYFVINTAGHHVFRDQPRAFNAHLTALLAS